MVGNRTAYQRLATGRLMMHRHEWGLRVRPYLTTGGRTEVDPRVRVDSTVMATGRIDPSQIRADHGQALDLCRRPASVAELAAQLGQTVQITKVLVSDLIGVNAVIMRDAPHVTTRAHEPDLTILEAVLSGLRKL